MDTLNPKAVHSMAKSANQLLLDRWQRIKVLLIECMDQCEHDDFDWDILHNEARLEWATREKTK